MFGRYWLLRKQVFILVLYHTAFTVYMLLTDFYFNLGYFYSVVCIGIKSNKCISLTIQCVCLFFYLLVCVKYVHKSHRPGDESLVPWQALLASEKCECFRHLLKCVGVCRWKAQLLLWRVCMLLFSEASLSNGELLMSVCRHVSVCKLFPADQSNYRNVCPCKRFHWATSCNDLSTSWLFWALWLWPNINK